MRFEEVARLRPVTLVRPAVLEPGPFPQVAPSCGVTSETSGPVTLSLASGDVLIEGIVEHGASIRVTAHGRTTTHRPRRHRWPRPRVYDAVALTLTGAHATVLTRTGGEWTGRARVDLSRRGPLMESVDTHAPAFLAGLRVDGTAPLVAGPFGQLGLRDLRVVTREDGSPYTRREGEVLLTGTSAGPGFFDTAHTSIWSLDLDNLELTHLSDVFFRREGKVYGDHATHLVSTSSTRGTSSTDVTSSTEGRDEWLVATSTWGDFDGTGVGVTLARSSDDLLTGTHVLDAEPLALPTDGPSAGVWDPHLVRADGGWLVGYVSATQVAPRFRFHPVLASGPSLDALTLRAARPDRRATEGTTIVRVSTGSTTDPPWRVLASDGRDNPRRVRGRFPVFDLDLQEVETLDADYLSNLPWPTLVPAPEGAVMITFDGTPSGGRLLGYGTHGDVVVLREDKDPQSSSGE